MSSVGDKVVDVVAGSLAIIVVAISLFFAPVIWLMAALGWVKK